MCKSENEEVNKEVSTTDSNLTSAGTFPIVKEKVTISAFAATRPAADDFENNEFTKWLEEQTNVHIDWYVANEQDTKQKLSLMMSGGDYPDILLQAGFSFAEQLLYGQQGIIISLNGLIEKYGIETKKMFAQYSLAKEVYTLNDGNIYNLPAVNDCFHCKFTQKM